MDWLPSLKDVSGLTLSPHGGHFLEKPPVGLIAARVPIAIGKLTTCVRSGAKWQFRKYKTAGGQGELGPTQLIAQAVLWTFKGTGSEFVLHLKQFSGPNSRDFVFTPTSSAPGGSKSLTIVIGNTTQQDTGVSQTSTVYDDDPDFLAYYAFAVGNPHKDGRRPVHDGTLPCTSLCGALPILDEIMKAHSMHTNQRANGGGKASGPDNKSLSGMNCGPDGWP
jgi:hypothetical protein